MKYKDYFGYKVSACGTVLGKRGNPMSPSDNGRGYKILTLLVEGKPKTKAVHRIVAETWIPNPNNLTDVDHIDGDKLNNCSSNLRWVTHGENIRHCYTLEGRSAKGQSNARCQTDEETVRKICKLLDEGMMPAKIRDMGYKYSLIRAIREGKNWRHISEEYSFSSRFRD